MGLISDIVNSVFSSDQTVASKNGDESNASTQGERSTKSPSDFNKSMDNSEYANVIELIDANTGKPVKINTFQDSIRLSRAGSTPTDKPSSGDTIVHNKTINSNLIKDLVYSGSDMSPKDCVASIGSYITEYTTKRITSLGDKNADLSKIDENSQVLNDLTFRNYVANGAEPQSLTSSEADKKDSTKVDGISRQNAGIGLGQSTVINPPFQFNKRDDVRTNPVYTKIGRVYSTQIMNNWPVALIQPGRFKYNTSFMKLLGFGGGASANEMLIRTGGEGIKGLAAKFFSCIADNLAIVGTIGSAIFGGSRAVEFRQSINLYKIYVRFLWTNLAADMGLIDGTKYAGSIKNLNLNSVLPTNYLVSSSEIGTDGKFANYLNDQYLPFRCGKGVTTTESFSNSMSSNPLMDKINEISQSNNEAANGDSVTQALFTKGPGTALQGFALKAASSFSDAASVASGKGFITLPDVFTSSTFTRSFSFDFKFHSPYGDPMSIFENEYIPYMMLLAITAPRQTGKLSYTSPFAVRIMVKNRIMINFGMVESLTLTRGGDNNDWTPQGYPKTLTCALSIKDMEPNISLPLASRGPLRSAMEVMFPTTGISEYLASLGGLSMHDLSLFSRGKRAVQTFTSSWNAKLDKDNMFSTVANTRFFSNIMGMFATTDLDRYNRLGDTMAQNMGENELSVTSKPFMPSFVAHAVGENGADAVTQIKSDAAGISAAMTKISSDLSAEGESHYSN